MPYDLRLRIIISIHALREEGDAASCKIVDKDGNISIHALREEGDHATSRTKERYSIFLSTPSARRATCIAVNAKQHDTISIHALREEGDRFESGHVGMVQNFYPRPPRGGRRWTDPLW